MTKSQFHVPYRDRFSYTVGPFNVEFGYTLSNGVAGKSFKLTDSTISIPEDRHVDRQIRFAITPDVAASRSGTLVDPHTLPVHALSILKDGIRHLADQIHIDPDGAVSDVLVRLAQGDLKVTKVPLTVSRPDAVVAIDRVQPLSRKPISRSAR